MIITAHPCCTHCAGISAGDDRETRGCTDRRTGKRMVKSHCILSQPVEVGCISECIAIAAKQWAVVFTDDPEDVRRIGWFRLRIEKERQEGE